MQIEKKWMGQGIHTGEWYQFFHAEPKNSRENSTFMFSYFWGGLPSFIIILIGIFR